MSRPTSDTSPQVQFAIFFLNYLIDQSDVFEL